MTPDALLALSGLVLAMAFLAACWVQSLRAFSRSRLAALGRQYEREDRFGEVLRLQGDALLAGEFVLTGGLALGTVLLAQSSPSWILSVPQAPAGWPSWLATLILVIVVYPLVFALLPWSLARVTGERWLFHTWPAVSLMVSVMRPLLSLANRWDTLCHRVAGRDDPRDPESDPIAEELQSVVDEGERGGLLESRAGRMIQRIVELSEQDVRDVMTPRTDIVFVNQSDSIEAAKNTFLQAGHSRVPVIHESPDDILGILYAKDLLKLNKEDEGTTALTDILREPLYVPETTTIDTLLERMKRERLHMAIVLDEYGGVVGLVTLEDILEEIVGEISDEYDEEMAEKITTIDDRTLEVDARVRIDDLNEEFHFELPEDGDFDTIGGFVFSELGRVPVPGDHFIWRNLTFTVLDADRRKVNKLRIDHDSFVTSATDNGHRPE